MISIYFDGGAKPNPGTGYGSWEIINDSPATKSRQTGTWLDRIGEFHTNNQAEYITLLRALEMLLFRTKPVTEPVQIWTDSKLVANQVAGKWKVKHPNMKPMHRNVMAMLKHVERWSINWQPRENNMERFGH